MLCNTLLPTYFNLLSLISTSCLGFLPSVCHADTVKSVDDASVSHVADLFHVSEFFPQRRDQFARVSRKGNDLLDSTSFQPSHREGSVGVVGGRGVGKQKKKAKDNWTGTSETR